MDHLCSIVMSHNPMNVKALFRRASATFRLANYELASWDLKLAFELEPSNLEVVRKLREVELFLQSPSTNIREQHLTHEKISSE